ncbi:hypothetical protein ERHA54_50390 (plasmid) [Erwinia rhapontici]|uniref:DUF485 domain-containing protein n=1 Tax=Erwinia rhapontici TaxID=55212 RepID=UPI001BB38A0F|nr:DUF485 domain-containing protein [Erwinia rhapontici]BCQ42436.1 hypothetical protein ERHA54_50390 [Erwinia rhapontici]
MDNVIEKKELSIDEIYSSGDFKLHVRKKGLIITNLVLITFVFFFSLPLLNSLLPSVMKYQIVGSFNIGLLWVILQYPLGAAVAWCYAKKMGRYDDANWLTHYLARGKAK